MAKERPVDLLTTTLEGSSDFPFLKEHSGHRTNHWVVRVGGICYELAKDKTAPGGYDVRPKTMKEWEAHTTEYRKNQFKTIYTGVTTWPDDKLKECADELWKDVFKGKYKSQMQNCQEFCVWFLRCIVKNLDEENLTQRLLRFHPRGLLPNALFLGGVIGGSAVGSYIGKKNETAGKLVGGAVAGAALLKILHMGLVETWPLIERLIDLEEKWRNNMGYPTPRRRRRDVMVEGMKVWEH